MRYLSQRRNKQPQDILEAIRLLNKTDLNFLFNFFFALLFLLQCGTLGGSWSEASA